MRKKTTTMKTSGYFLICSMILVVLMLQEVVSEDAVTEEQISYAKGSVCGYCNYCKFCKLCDKDCPCETSPSKPNCKMCKYCKYCYLCSGICDTICQPGGMIDKFSAAIVNALPSHGEEFNKEEVEQDLDSVKPWLDRKDEL